MIILVSRGRPEKLARFFAAGKPTLPGMVVLDDDDPRLAEYAAVTMPPGWSTVVYPKTTVVESLNRAVGHALESNPPFIGWMADDVIPETPGWDARLAHAVEDYAVAYPEDKVHGRCTHFFVNGDVARRLWNLRGWFVPPTLKHLFFDTFWEDLAGSVHSLVKLPSVIVRHEHFSVGGEYDSTYAGRQTQGDSAAYARFVEKDFVRLKRDMWGAAC